MILMSILRIILSDCASVITIKEIPKNFNTHTLSHTYQQNEVWIKEIFKIIILIIINT